MMTDGERTLVLDKAKKYLRDAGFDNVVILTNEGGSQIRKMENEMKEEGKNEA